MRVFFDNNVLVSAYTTRDICADILRYILTEHDLLTGGVNLVELRRVLRDRFHASPELIETVDAKLQDQTIIPNPPAPPRSPFATLTVAMDGSSHRRSMVMLTCSSHGTKISYPSHLRLPYSLSIPVAAGIAFASRNAEQRVGPPQAA